MSQPKVLFKEVFFRREGAGSSQTVRPTLSAPDQIGTVLSVSGAPEIEEAVFDKPIGGKWVDYEALNQRDREVFTVVVSELSELFWELIRRTLVTLAGGAGIYTPGTTVTTRGWFRLFITDEQVRTIDDVYMWCKADIVAHELPQLGYVQATFTLRKLYSDQATGSLANIA